MCAKVARVFLAIGAAVGFSAADARGGCEREKVESGPSDVGVRGVQMGVVKTGTINGLLPKDPMGNTRAGFSAHGRINRQDFGMKWSKVLDNGGLVVGDDVDINLEIEVIKQK